MIPALERCCVILSRLAGLAKYQGSNDTTGLSIQHINRVMDTIAALNLVASRILSYIVEELELFAAFSVWLRREIDKLASESSSGADESLEKESLIDHGKILLYLQTALTSSRLAPFFKDSSVNDLEKNWESLGDGVPVLELIDNQLRKHDEYQTYTKALLPLDSLCHSLSKQASALFHQIAEAEKRNVFFGQPVVLGPVQDDTPLAMKMCAEVCIDNNPSILAPGTDNPKESSLEFVTYIASGIAGRANHLRIFRIECSITNGLSSTTGSSVATLELGEGAIKDLCFLNESRLLVLYFSKGK